MWILDSAYRDGGIDLWIKDGAVTKVHYEYNPPFHVHFHDPHAHYEMIEALEERYDAKECTIRTIFSELSGYAVTAGRDVAEAIERQAQYGGDLFNVDVRRDQRFMAERGIFPCAGEGDDRFSPEIRHDLSVMDIRINGDPALSAQFSEIDVKGACEERLTGETKTVLAELFGVVGSLNPDVILMRMPIPGCRKFGISHSSMILPCPSRGTGNTGRWTHARTGVTAGWSTRNLP